MIAHHLRRVFIALLVAAMAVGSAAAAAKAMTSGCGTTAELHAAHIYAMQDFGSAADGETAPTVLNHTCLHCTSHGCAAILAFAPGFATKTNLWPPNAPSVSEHAVFGQRSDTLQRPPKA